MIARVSEFERRRCGFSLAEVVLAIAVFAVAVTVVLALLPTFARQNAETAEQFTAERLAAAANVELKRLAVRDGFTALANSIPVMNSPLGNGLVLVGSRSGDRVAKLADAEPLLPAGEQYFEIELWRFVDAPGGFTANRAALVVFARVTWPYRIPGAVTPTRPAERNQVTFVTAVNP
jgi:prepilin-type N-terminal cleavage/methylation domain-containing protein